MHGAKVVDLRDIRGNGPFNLFLGVVLHVNADRDGTTDDFYRAPPPTNPDSVTPNFQVYKDGSIHQYLPFDWQPWCQRDGNNNYAAIETAGVPEEPLTDEQLKACARILAAYHQGMGLRLRRARTPGERGLGTHKMGGVAWGGHPCPGKIRSRQRRDILALARGHVPTPTPTGPHLRRQWPAYMGEGDFFGLITGPDNEHGGIDAAEQADVKAIQLRLQVLGFAPNTAGWADGIYEQPTVDAVAAWQRARTAEQDPDGRVRRDDWRKLFTY